MMKENDLVNEWDEKNRYMWGEKMTEIVSLKDIAEICQVSVSTVSKALNNRTDVGKAKKEEIKRVAKELNYIPNYMASTLKSKRTRNIGVLLDEDTGTKLLHEHFAGILNSFKDTSEERGYFLTFLNAGNLPVRLSYTEQCQYLNFDGVLVLCADFKSPEVKELLDLDMPIAVINHTTEKHINIFTNSYDDMSRLMQFIYRRGHRRIAYMHGEDSEVTKGRVDAYMDFMRDHKLPVPKEYFRTCPYRDYERGSAVTKEILAYSKRPTCIIYPDDLTAVGGLNLMQEAGMVIPRDISIAGYDGLNLVNIVRPRITTIFQDTLSMGAQAGNKLINRIEFPMAKTMAETAVVDGMVEPGESVATIGRRR